MNPQTTTLLIRPAARGGKYLGHDAADPNNKSALVALIDVATGKIVACNLADAPTVNSAGPKKLMQPVSRSAPYAADSQTVQVQLSVEISAPADFRVLVFGPLSHLDQARLAQADITVLPGVDVGTSSLNPEGLVIEVPGLCISGVTASLQGSQFSCSAKVTMMCGCPIGNDKGWCWPDTDFSVTLVTRKQSGVVHHYSLAFIGTPDPNHNSLFAGQWTNQSPDDPVSEAWLYASEPKLGNQGRYRISPSPVLPTLHPDVRRALLQVGYQID